MDITGADIIQYIFTDYETSQTDSSNIVYTRKEDGTETEVEGTKTTTYDFEYNQSIVDGGDTTTISLYE